MELRKKKEIEYYDKRAERRLAAGKEQKSDFEGFWPGLLSSYDFCYKILGENCQNKIVLDYGCGNGIHTISLAKMGAEKVIGIDLSAKSLEVAREKARREGLERKIEFILMDCEKMEFSENTFDIIFDGGTFSSLDLNKAMPELVRVLKPDGFLIGIETFGHNPFTNLKRKINKLTRKRTQWAAEHIFKDEDIKRAKNYFSEIKAWFFHPISFLAFPFLKNPGGKIILKLLETADAIFLASPLFKKYAFKIVLIFSLPKK